MNLSSQSNPFIGLRSYESDESILFFGRNEQTIELLEKLHHFQFLAVIGSSGSGKSSLVKAGLIPRLKAGYLVNEKSSWTIVVMKPGEDALQNFIETILTVVDDKTAASDFRENIQENGVDAILDIIRASNKNNTNIFLLIDQFEELFRFSLIKEEIVRKNEAADFVNLLLDLSRQQTISFYVTITMRSDFIGDCSQFYNLPEAINKGLYLVPRLSRTQLETIVEGPVRLFNQNINPALTSKVINDSQLMQDSLPLLQHVLMRTWDFAMNNKNGGLTLTDYEQAGGINKALSNHADEVLKGMTEEELKLTQKIFQSLTTVDQNGRKVRRPAHLKELASITGANKESLLGIINRFIEGNKSFLITTKIEDKDDLLIDISHESLIRQWSLLNSWVDEEADSAKVFLRLIESEKLYTQKNKNLLTGNELNQFWQWYFTFNPGPEWAKRYSDSYTDCIDYLKQSEAAEKKQRSLKLRNQRLLIAAVAAVFVIISLFSIKVYRNYINNKNQLALNYWTSSQAFADENNDLNALHLLAQSAVTSTQKDFINNLLISAENFLPAASLKNMFLCSDVITSASLSTDGKLILTACNDGSVSVIDKEGGKHIIDLANNGFPVNTAVFSTDEKFILTACNDKTASLWNAQNGSLIKSFQHSAPATDANFSNSGKFIVTACADSCVRVWDIHSGNQLYLFKQDAVVTSAAFSQNEKYLLTCGNDSTARLWNISTGKTIYTFHHNAANVTTAVFNNNETLILTTAYDSTVRVWNAENGTLMDSVKTESEITCGNFSADGKWIAFATRNKYVRFWNVEKHQILNFALKHQDVVYDIDFSKDGKWLVTGGADKIVRVWDIETAANNKSISFQTNNSVSAAVFNADGKKVVTGGYDSVARLWDVEKVRLLDSFNHGSAINNVALSKDGNWLLTCGNNTTAKLWNVITGKQENEFKNVRSAVFNTNDKTILTTGDDSIIRVRTIAGEEQKILKFKEKIRSGVLSHDKKTILITTNTNTAYLLNAATGQEIHSFKQDDVIKTAVFSRDGKRMLTAGWDSSARVWNVETALQDGASMKHHMYISGATFSDNGKWIITSGLDNTVRLWDADTKKEITSLLLDAPANSAVISSDEKTILIANRDSKAYIFKIPGDLDIPTSLFKLQAQVITGVAYNTVTNETECISPAEWKLLNERYQREAKDHYKACSYPAYNLWARFYKTEANEASASPK